MSFVLSQEAKAIASKVADDRRRRHCRETLPLTIAVVGATEQLYRTIGKPHPAQETKSE